MSTVEAPPAPLTTQRRPTGPSVGPVPLAGVLVVEVGFAVAVALVVLERGLLPLAGAVFSVALLVGLLRVRGRWLVAWIALALRFRLRVREREAEPLSADTDGRLRLLRLLTGDLTVARRRDHDGREVGLLGHASGWSAVLALDPASPEGAGGIVATDPSASFPLAAIAGCLADRGVVLDAVSAVWHCRGLREESPAAAAYREVLGPLPSPARREAWLVVRLDPARCPDAVAERGGGVVGAHRAVVGALARISRVLADHGLAVRPLGVEDVLTAATGAADAEGSPGERLREHWGAVVVDEVGHATYAVTDWAPSAAPLTELTGPSTAAARSATLALTLEPDPVRGADRTDGTGGDGSVGLRGTIRVTADTPDALAEAGADLLARARTLGLRLDPLDGQHTAGLAATLPLGTQP